MLKLNGNNLGKRHQELNAEVTKATSQNVNFDLIKGLNEETDVDRLYKIDIASVYKNIDYILETLKCGDSFYVSRALKCAWLFENENSHIINPDYLHHEVFPFMSIKMKKKLLTTISIHVRDEKRAEEFYNYCLKDKQIANIAGKFLIWTSIQYKLEYIISHYNHIDDEKLEYIIGNSFELAENYLEKEKSEHRNTNESVHKLRYLIHISDKKYLNLLERYTDIDSKQYYGSKVPQLGLRLSKLVITKHKERVLNNIPLYLKKINLNVVAKHSSVEDVKKYVIALMPPSADEFWSRNFYDNYKKIIKVLPQNEVFAFLREIFLSKYVNESFEMSKQFYDLNYYNLLTNKEKELWALQHLKQSNEFLGPDNDYLWYQFVNYDLAFIEIKKLIAACTNPYNRTSMINVLVDSVKNGIEMEKLLKYYYERHVNESEDNKMLFIDNVFDKHNVFKFDECCWGAFSKILHSTSIFSPKTCSYASNKYKTFVILYHFIHDKSIPEVLDNYIVTTSNAENIKYEKEMLYNKLNDEQINLIYYKFINLCTDKLKKFDSENDDVKVKKGARIILDFALVVMKLFGKTKVDCPEIFMKYVELDSAYYDGHEFFLIKEDKITEGNLLRLLKLDYKLLLQKLVDESNEFSRIRLNNILRKIKIYFPSDLAQDWLTCCELLLQKSGYEHALFSATIGAIFHIGSQDYKIEFVSKYVPEEGKISHDTIDKRLLTIQEGICRYALYSRPPIPLECIMPYIKGDYVHYCLPMFGSYLSNLPTSLCIKFVSGLLNTPVSIQKHALRLAFQCFSVEDLANLVVNVWETTKNVSLRMIIYKALCDKIENVDENYQTKLFEILKTLTLDLHENDDDEVFSLIKRFRLTRYKEELLKTAWCTIQNFSEQRSKNVQRKCDIIKAIETEIAMMDKEFCRLQILNEFISSMLTNQNIGELNEDSNVKSLIEAKWELAAKYIIFIDSDQIEKSLELIYLVLKKCTEMWNFTANGYYRSRKFMFWFIDKILQNSYHKKNKADSIPVLEYIIKVLAELLSISQIYTLYLKLNLIVISKKVIGSNECNYDHLIQGNVSNSLATEIQTLLKGLKERKLLYSSFFNEIGALVINAIETMCYGTNLNDSEVIQTLVSARLVDGELSEAQLLALIILPRERPEETEHIWLDVIGKAQSGDNEELHAYVHEHFENANFKER